MRLSSRALEILIALTERAGEIVSKQELMAQVWPDTVVAENTLRVHVAALRKALRDGEAQARYITNIPNRGYCFVAEVRRVPLRAATGTLPPGNLPPRLTRMIGREEAVAALIAQVPQRRLVTLVGAGGMGKTTVAVAVAAALAPAYAHGAWFIDLSAVQGGPSLPAVFAAALGLPNPQAETGAGLVDFLRDKHCLLVVDNCEHVLSAAADLCWKTCCAPRRCFSCWPPAASRCSWTASGCTGCLRWRSRTLRSSRYRPCRRWATPRSSCSSSARRRA